jgi:hypothetical protein
MAEIPFLTPLLAASDLSSFAVVWIFSILFPEIVI